MKKSEAIEQMLMGKKITHRLFGPDEWITIEGDFIKTEDNTLIPIDFFWEINKGMVWEIGYEIYEEVTKYVVISYMFMRNNLVRHDVINFSSDVSLLASLANHKFDKVFTFPNQGEVVFLVEKLLEITFNVHIIRII